MDTSEIKDVYNYKYINLDGLEEEYWILFNEKLDNPWRVVKFVDGELETDREHSHLVSFQIINLITALEAIHIAENVEFKEEEVNGISYSVAILIISIILFYIIL